jgi:ABC-type amino acid transport system permease subunit
MRDMKHLALASAAAVFVQTFRNIPLILQLVFWYAICIHMPGPRQAMSFGDSVFLTNRGVMIPVLNVDVQYGVWVVIASVVLMGVLFVSKASVARFFTIWLGGTVAIIAVAALLFVPTGEAIISTPELKGLRFVGGITISIEFVAMVISIVLYGSAYIAEVVRGGLKQVSPGLIEAGQAVGLSSKHIWSRIKMPMALRTVIPPLGNQWIFIMKATTIGVAIGFSDLFYVISTSITQSGQTLELIALLMGAFLLINFSIAQFVNWLNARMQIKAH